MNLDFSILTATFNNHRYTDRMIESFYKNYKSVHTYVLDNSTTNKYIPNKQFNITLLNNFNFLHTPNLHSPSRNHCSSISYAFNEIKDDWILLVDNDVLFKNTVRELLDNFDEQKFDILGQIGHDSFIEDRLFPYFCLINLKKVKEHNIQYYHEGSIVHRLKDTGASFYQDAISENFNICNINLKDYIIHLKNGSFDKKHSKSTDAQKQQFLNILI